MTARKDKFPFLAFREPWANNPNNIWLASTLNLYRNLKRYPFPPKLDKEGQTRVMDLLSKALCTSGLLQDPVLVNAETTGPLEKEFLYEHFLTPRSFQEAMEGEGFLTDSTGQIFSIFNVRDHLQLQLINCRDHLETAWGKLNGLEEAVGKALEFAYDKFFGFLTSDPRLCGTGLVVHLYLHVPAIIHTDGLGDLLASLKDEEVDVASVEGNLEQIVGDILTIRNRATIGLTDENILQMLQTVALKVMVREKGIRSELRTSQDTELKDRVSRAFGLLSHSYSQETLESWSAISLLKLGTDLGWVEGVSQSQLNDLFFSSRRAHLVAEYPEEVSQEEIPLKRAEFLHQSLADAKLTI
jgi:protein arginine kinase